MADQAAFDIFQSVKNFLYLGDYNKCLDEVSNLDINYEDLSQEIFKNFYTFLSLIESQKYQEIDNLLSQLKNSSEKQKKICHHLFLFLVMYVYKGKFESKRFENYYKELNESKIYDPTIFPAIYVLSLICIKRKEYAKFLPFIEKFECEIEILSLKFHLMMMLNKEEEMQKIINSMELKDSDSTIFQLCKIIYDLYYKNNWEQSISSLQTISKNNKVSPKIFNLIGLALMNKGNFDEAIKIIKLGKESCEKNEEISLDYHCLLVNAITCYRNLGKYDEIKNLEEYLKKNDPSNDYFLKEKLFDDNFDSAIAN